MRSSDASVERRSTLCYYPAVAIESWKRLTADERRTQLVELGVELFNSRHYSEVSVDDIARAAGISKGLLYHYFPSKEEFFVAGVEHGSQVLLDATDPPRELPQIEQLRHGLRGYLDYVEDNRIGYLNIFRGETAALPGIVRVCERTRATIAERFIETLELPGHALPATRAAFRSFQGFFEALVLDWLEGREITRAQIELMSIVSVTSSSYTGLHIDLGPESPILRERVAMAGETLGMLARDYGYYPFGAEQHED